MSHHFSNFSAARNHYYFVSYRHATGFGSCEPLKMDAPLTTAGAMRAARISIARQIGQRDNDVVITFVMPLPDEKYVAHRTQDEDRLREALDQAAGEQP